MADTYAKISELTEVELYTELTGSEEVPAILSSANLRVKLSDIAKYVIGVVSGALRAIGSDITGALVTTSDSQELTNKDISTNCTVNGGASLVVTSTELNYCSGLTGNVASSISTINDSIAAIAESIATVEGIVDDFSAEIDNNYKFTITRSSGSATAIELLASTIDAVNKISYDNLIVKYYLSEVNGTEKLLTEQSGAGVKILTTTVDGDQILQSITLPVTAQNSYLIVVYYSLYIE